MPVTPIGRAGLRGFRVRPAGAVAPAALHAPWPRSARTAKAGWPPRYATSGAAFLAASSASFPVGGSRESIPGPPACSLSYPRKNPGRCDLVHIPLDDAVLDRRHEQRDPNLIRRAGRPPHRLRPDRHRCRRGSGCAGLPPAGLNPHRARQRAVSRAFKYVCTPVIKFIVSGFFRGAAVAASGRGLKFRKNPSSTAHAAAANHPPLL